MPDRVYEKCYSSLKRSKRGHAQKKKQTFIIIEYPFLYLNFKEKYPIFEATKNTD